MPLNSSVFCHLNPDMAIITWDTEPVMVGTYVHTLFLTPAYIASEKFGEFLD